MALSKYMSNKEKATYIHFIALMGLANGLIKEHMEKTEPDKEYLKCLRTAVTWIKKATDMRSNALDPDMRKQLVNRIERTEPVIFASTYQAKKEFEDHLKIRSMYHIPMTEIYDLYEAIIERMCKTCKRNSFKKCALYNFCMKYEIEPYNPDEKVHCPFSYAYDKEKEEKSNVDHKKPRD